jgi:hypothetical protein
MISDKIVFFYPTSCNRDLFISNVYLYFHLEELPLAFPFQKMKFSFSTWKTSYSHLPYGNLNSLFFFMMTAMICFCWDKHVLESLKKSQLFRTVLLILNFYYSKVLL